MARIADEDFFSWVADMTKGLADESRSRSAELATILDAATLTAMRLSGPKAFHQALTQAKAQRPRMRQST
jgi:hypothetical protein